MYNRSKSLQASSLQIEKNLRDHSIDSHENKGNKVTEGLLKDRSDKTIPVTEKQMENTRNADLSETIMEKRLNEDKGKYVQHRVADDDLSVPPMSILVEQIRQKRLSNDYKESKNAHWSIEFDDKQQNGSLPEWPKNVGQHDKLVLNNDPQRFENDKSVTKLVGHITVADIDNVVCAIKTGETHKYDAAIVSILDIANREHRELNIKEQKAINELKISRTSSIIKNSAKGK